MKKGVSIELAMIVIFLVIFFIWIISKCSSNKNIDLDNIKAPENEIVEDTITTTKSPIAVVKKPEVVTTKPKVIETPSQELKTVPLEPTKPASAPKPIVKAPEQNTLYVVIDNINVRVKPNLKAKSLGKLRLYDRVIFMNVVTDKPQKVNLGTEVANERWVKIKTKKGTIGWVYGAGVNYYKMKRKGNL